MLSAYLRLSLVVAGLIGAAVLFVFAFTAAAVVVFVSLLVLALLGKPVKVDWWTRGRPTGQQDGSQPFDPRFPGQDTKQPVTIDHDPNDLPPGRS